MRVALPLLLLAAPALAAQATLRVPQDHPTIQAAVDAAADGDTILVSAGTWEAFVIDGRSGLRVQGKGAATVVLDAVVRGTLEAAISVLGSTDITLDRLRVGSSAGDGVRVDASQSVELLRLRSAGVAGHDLRVQGDSSGVHVDKGRFESTGGGTQVSVEGGSDFTLTRSRLQGSGTDGLHLDGVAGVLLERLEVLEPALDGLEFTGVAGLQASRVTVSDAGSDSLRGSLTHSTLERVTVLRGGDDGILLDFDPLAEQLVLDRCRLVDIGFDGLALAGNGHVVRDCRLLRIDDDALEISGSDHVVEDTRITDAGDDGVEASGSGLQLLGVSVAKVPWDAIKFSDDVDGGAHVLRDCRVSGSGDDGIVLTGGSGSLLEDNRVSQPGDSGFQLAASSGNTLAGNRATKATGAGFNLLASTDNTLTGNKAVKSGGFGLFDNAGPGANTYADNVFGSESITGP